MMTTSQPGSEFLVNAMSDRKMCDYCDDWSCQGCGGRADVICGCGCGRHYKECIKLYPDQDDYSSESRAQDAIVQEEIHVTEAKEESDYYNQELSQNIDKIQPEPENLFTEYDDYSSETPISGQRITPAQKKIILLMSTGAMGLFALIFIVAILMKQRRKAMEKARDAIIVESGLLPVSGSQMGFAVEKDPSYGDDKKVDSSSHQYAGQTSAHSFISEKQLKN